MMMLHIPLFTATIVLAVKLNHIFFSKLTVFKTQVHQPSNMCGEDEDIMRFCTICVDFITTFLWIYLVRVLHKNKHKLLFVKRGSILLQTYVYVSLLHGVIFKPMTVGLSTDCVPQSIKAIIIYFAFGFFYLTLELSHTIFALRFLLHYANIQRTQLQSIDNHNDNNININFIVKYHKIFGNPHKIFIICMIITIIQASIILIIVIFFGFPYSYANSSNVSNWIVRIFLPFWIVRLFITFYCFIKSKYFKDYWLITKEFKYLIITLLSVTLCFLLSAVAANIIYATFPEPKAFVLVNILVYSNLALFSIWALVSTYISVVWVNKMDDRLSYQLPTYVDDQSKLPNHSTSVQTRMVTILDVFTDKQCMLSHETQKMHD